MGGCTSKDGVSDPHGKISAFKSADELVDFSTFFPEGTNSSLSRNLTAELWEEFKDQSDSAGVTFKTCIF